VEATIAYKLGKVPQTVVVSADGTVLENWHGAYEGGMLQKIEGYFGVSLNKDNLNQATSAARDER
jgi:hypothetical protein